MPSFGSIEENDVINVNMLVFGVVSMVPLVNNIVHVPFDTKFINICTICTISSSGKHAHLIYRFFCSCKNENFQQKIKFSAENF